MYPQDESAKFQDRVYVGGGALGLGATIGGQQAGYATEAPRGPSLMELVNAQLDQMLQQMVHLNARMSNMHDRAFGPIPRGVAGQNKAEKPQGLTGEISARIQGLQEQISEAHGNVESLSRLTGN